MATDEEVEAQRDTLTELRARLDEAKSGGTQAQRELENDITLTQMQAEEQRLLAEIAAAEALNNTMERGAAAPLDAAKDGMIRAVAQQKALEEQAAEAARAAAPPAPGDSSTKGAKIQNQEG